MRELEFKNFLEAIDFVNKIAFVSEEINHHPDLLIHSYNKIKVMITTHSKQAVTEKDYDLAKRIDELL